MWWPLFQVADEGDAEDIDPLAHEVVTGDVEEGISIKHLTKIYGNV